MHAGEMNISERLKTLRNALGVSAVEMADMVGIDSVDGGSLIQKMEHGSCGVPGSIQRLMRYMEQAVEISKDAQMTDWSFKVLPRWLDCSDMEDDESNTEIIFHTRWPRFFAVHVDELEDENAEELCQGGIPVVKLPDDLGLGWLVILWLDEPSSKSEALVEEAALLKVRQAMQDLPS